jgi:elongation factor P
MGFTTNIYQGQTIRYNNELFTVIEREFAAMGKGSSFNRTRLRNIVTGKVIPITFKDGDTVEEVDVEKFNVQFLYNDSNKAYFMNPTNFEQFEFDIESIPHGTDFLHQDATYMASKYEDKIIAIVLPLKIHLVVTDTPDGVRGDTVSNASKDAIVETGAKVQVPLFIKNGDKISINTESYSYVSKA